MDWHEDGGTEREASQQSGSSWSLEAGRLVHVFALILSKLWNSLSKYKMGIIRISTFKGCCADKWERSTVLGMYHLVNDSCIYTGKAPVAPVYEKIE